MTDFTYQQSLPLKLLPSYGRHDFVVGESNHEAVKLVDNFYKSKIYGLIITGPSASGKSHWAPRDLKLHPGGKRP